MLNIVIKHRCLRWNGAEAPKRWGIRACTKRHTESCFINVWRSLKVYWISRLPVPRTVQIDGYFGRPLCVRRSKVASCYNPKLFMSLSVIICSNEVSVATNNEITELSFVGLTGLINIHLNIKGGRLRWLTCHAVTTEDR